MAPSGQQRKKVKDVSHKALRGQKNFHKTSELAFRCELGARKFLVFLQWSTLRQEPGLHGRGIEFD
jgi:hypothetical protein